MLVLPSWDLLLRWFHSLLVDEPLQLPLPNVSFDLLLQVVVVGGVITVITVETTVLVSRPFIRASLQLARKGQGSFVLNLHQDLIDRDSQWGEAHELPCGGLRAHVLPSFSYPHHLSPPILSYVFLSFPFLGILFLGQLRVFHVHVLSLWVVLIQRK